MENKITSQSSDTPKEEIPKKCESCKGNGWQGSFDGESVSTCAICDGTGNEQSSNKEVTAEEAKVQGKYDVWDWIVTKTGQVRQITHDDMMDLKYEDIERHARIEEMPAEVAISEVRKIADKHAGVEKAREFLSKYDSMGKFQNANVYSEYTALKAIQDAWQASQSIPNQSVQSSEIAVTVKEIKEWIDKREKELLGAKEKMGRYDGNAWIEIPDYKLSILYELQRFIAVEKYANHTK